MLVAVRQSAISPEAVAKACGWLWHNVLEPILEVLGSLALAIAAPPLIPVIFAGWAWRALPECLKPFILNFLIDVLLALLRASPSVMFFGPLWPLLRAAAIGFLVRAKAFSDEQKVKIINKVARIVSGSSVQFWGGLVAGFFKGMFDGIADPFIMIFDILKAVAKVFDWMAKIALHWAQYQPIIERYLGIVRPLAAQVAAKAHAAMQQFFSGAGSMSGEELIHRLGDLWQKLLGQAETAGGKIAEKLGNFLLGDGSEFDLGYGIGWVLGNIAVLIILSYLSGGAWAEGSVALKAIQTVAQILNWPYEMLGKALGALGKAFEPLMGAIKGMFAALRVAEWPVIRELTVLLERLFATIEKFAQELALALVEKLGSGVLERLTEAVGEQLARKLVLELGEPAAAHLLEALGGEALKVLGSRFTGRELQALLTRFGDAALKDLATLGEEKLGQILTKLGRPGFERIFSLAGKDGLERLAALEPGQAQRLLALNDELLKNVLQLNQPALQKLLALDDAALQRFAALLGPGGMTAAQMQMALDKFGADGIEALLQEGLTSPEVGRLAELDVNLVRRLLLEIDPRELLVLRDTAAAAERLGELGSYQSDFLVKLAKDGQGLQERFWRLEDSVRAKVQTLPAQEQVGFAERLASSTGGPPAGTYPVKQLQHEWKHAGDFGIPGATPGNFRITTDGPLFTQAIQSAIGDPRVLTFPGTYKGGACIHCFNVVTGLDVFFKPNGEFWGGFRLGANQIRQLLTTANFF